MARVANLEASLQALAEAHNANAEAFRSCLYSLEARQWMIMRAMDEFVGKGNPNITLDWADYEAQYRDMVEKQQAEDEAAKIDHTDDPDAGAVVFGG